MALQVKDVMGVVAIAVHPEATFTELVTTMRRFKVGAVAVIDGRGHPIGVVSEDDLLLKETVVSAGGGAFEGCRQRREHEKADGTTAREIMTSPAITVTRETPVREAARLMHVNRVKQLPVIDPVSGRIAGTVHQADLLKVFSRPASDILADVAASIVELGLDPAAFTVSVDTGTVRVRGRLAGRAQAVRLADAGRRIEGVVDLKVEAVYDHGDAARTGSR